VELSENATTSPITASTPSVIALSARVRTGGSDRRRAA
jgi:xanthine dehydrogenase iron-sulfur cluster and FAD-binding subunit A